MKQHLEVKKDLYWVGALDKDLRIFDIIMYTEYGTSYNSYVLRGQNKTAVFETVKDKFYDEFAERIKSAIDPATVDYIVLNHTEPDHSGSAYRIYRELCPNATIVGTATTIRFLKEIANEDFPHLVAKDGMTLDLGGYTLQFIMAPFLHWPDSMYTYIPENKTLVTCDSFGCHYADEKVVNDQIEGDFLDAYKYYFDMIMGPFKSYVKAALAKIDKLELETICPGHGPVLRTDLEKYINYYREWSETPDLTNTVVIPYVSAYTYTKTMAEEIAKGIEAVGGIEVKLHDMVYDKKQDVLAEIATAKGVLLGTPTIVSDALPPIWEIAISLNPVIHAGKYAGVFGSYGWSGEGVTNIEQRLKQLRFKMPLPGLKINFKASEDQLKQCYDYGYHFGRALLGEEIPQAEEKKAPTPAKAAAKPQLWKCIVCGEVFEGTEPPEICPACGAGRDQFVVYQAETPAEKTDFAGKVVIIGGSAAAESAIKAIRERNDKADVTIITAEKYLPYYRPLLSDLISDESIEKQPNFFLHDEKWYEQNNVTLQLNQRVVEIDGEKKLVKTETGTTYPYDRLILANGSHNFVPVADALDKEGVFTIKDLEDAKAVYEYAKGIKNAVVVGGGLLGLEAASELIDQGIAVTVVELQEQVCPMQLDTEGSSLLQQIIVNKNVNLLLGKAVDEVLGTKKATGVKLVTGEVIEADMVLFSVGIRPNIQLAKTAGVEVNKGVIVNEKMETSVADLYACGDVTEFNNRSYALWMPALKQGKVAGANAVGANLTYEEEEAPALLNAFNTMVYSVGDIGTKSQEPKTEYQTLEYSNADQVVYKKLYFKENKLVGGILLGDIGASIALTEGVNASLPMEKAIEILK